jgi:hypothetical protein
MGTCRTMRLNKTSPVLFMFLLLRDGEKKRNKCNFSLYAVIFSKYVDIIPLLNTQAYSNPTIHGLALKRHNLHHQFWVTIVLVQVNMKYP